GLATLRRCDDHFFETARSVSMPIELTSMRLYRLLLRPRLSLSETYASLTLLTGASGELYDSWKGAFAFPFKLTIHRDGREHRYLLKITNVRSSAEPDLYRVVRAGEKYRTEY